jgi:hypothetical protein
LSEITTDAKLNSDDENDSEMKEDEDNNNSNINCKMKINHKSLKKTFNKKFCKYQQLSCDNENKI